MDTHYLPDETERYVGLARVNLNSLSFDLALHHAHRERSEKAVARLLRIYELEGCRRLDHCNYISGNVSASSLNQALQSSAVQRGQLPERGDRTIPRLNINKVDCLHGLHRILAAERFLTEEDDRWWTVRLYEELPQERFRHIVQQFPNSRPFSDGDVFRHIRLCRQNGDVLAEDMWWARLTVEKAKDLGRLLRSSDLVVAFDDLLHLRGLWGPIELGSLHRLLRLKCDEELVRYLRHIASSWSTILGDLDGDVLDNETVTLLQCLAPAASMQDLGSMTGTIVSRRAFRLVQDPAAREAIRQRLSQIGYLIPSLETLIYNLGWLEPCCAVLRNLVMIPAGKSLRRSLVEAYNRPNPAVVQWAEQDFRHRPIPLTLNDASLDYVQLWLYAMRHFPNMTEFTTKESAGERKEGMKLNARLLQGLGATAFRLGFRTPRACTLKSQDPEKALASQFILDIGLRRNNEAAQYIEEVTNILKRVLQNHNMSSTVTSTRRLPVPEPLHRVGRPRNAVFEASQRHLFLPRLFSDDYTDEIDAVFVCRDFVRSFFGTAQDQVEQIIEHGQDGPNLFEPSSGASASTFDDTNMHEPTAQMRIQELEGQVSDLEAQSQTVQESLTAAQLQYSQALAAANSQAAEREHIAQSEHAQELQAKNDTIQKLNEQIENLRREHDGEVQSILDGNQVRSDQMQAERQSAEQKLLEEQGSTSMLRTKLQELEAQLSWERGEQGHSDDARRTLEEQQERLTALQTENDTLEDTSSKKQEVITQLETRIQELEDLLARRTEEQDIGQRQQEDRLAGAHANLANAMSQSERLEKELRISHQQKEALQKEVDSTTDPLQFPTPLTGKRKNTALGPPIGATMVRFSIVVADGYDSFEKSTRDYDKTRDKRAIRERARDALQATRLDGSGKTLLMGDLKRPADRELNLLIQRWHNSQELLVVDNTVLNAFLQHYSDQRSASSRPGGLLHSASGADMPVTSVEHVSATATLT